MWMLGGLVYLINGAADRDSFFDIPLENLGSFLEGAFAPLAFLWLVIGLFIQQKELADNTEVLRQTSIQSEKQTQAIAATELNARQETFFKIADNVRRQMGSIAGMLYLSSMSSDEGGPLTRERSAELWHMLSTGDAEVFAREFLIVEQDQYGGYEALFYGTAVRRRHTEHFIDTFDRLMKLADNCDVDGLISGSLTQTGHGMLYNRMVSHRVEEGAAPKLVDAANYREIIQNTKS